MDHKDRTVENAYTQVAGSVSFRDYFEKYMSAEQQKQWLGPERYKIWQRGNLSLDKFIAPYHGQTFVRGCVEQITTCIFRNMEYCKEIQGDVIYVRNSKKST